jgi:glutaredoxin
MTYKLFTLPRCPKCPAAKELVGERAEQINCGTKEGMEEARNYQVATVPTLLVINDEGLVTKRITEVDIIKNEMQKNTQ